MEKRIDDLRELAESKQQILYNLCFRNAGVGFQWCDGNKDNWEKALYIMNYYPTIEEAIDAETERLKGIICK